MNKIQQIQIAVRKIKEELTMSGHSKWHNTKSPFLTATRQG